MPAAEAPRKVRVVNQVKLAPATKVKIAATAAIPVNIKSPNPVPVTINAPIPRNTPEISYVIKTVSGNSPSRSSALSRLVEKLNKLGAQGFELLGTPGIAVTKPGNTYFATIKEGLFMKKM
jgi:hypothetical protein